jgi:S-adenosylmethionine hydrolase
MAIITLTTDFGIKDPYTAMVKGEIHKALKDVIIVDVSHEIQPFDIAEGAFVVKNSYKNFPDGSIHVIGVDSLITPNKKALAALIDEHFFIACDNGILSLINAEITPKEIVEINIPQTNHSGVFSVKDVFVPVACHLARGGKLSVIGKKINAFRELSLLKPVVKDEKTIVGTVIYVDNYGNSITNISEKFFSKIGKKRNFTVRFRNHEFKEIFKSYNELVGDFDRESDYIGRGMALFGSSGFLEISIYKSNPDTVGAASTLFGLKKGSEIYVEFD